MSKCDVFLENYRDHYEAGQQIVGYVQLTFMNEKTVKSVKIRFKGECNTSWTETRGHYNSTTKRNETRTIRFSGNENYFRTEMNLLNNVSNEVTIPQGVHKYPFSFTLPLNLPSTFKDEYGSIAYSVKGKVARSFMKTDYEAKSEINIITPINLNIDASLRLPKNYNKTKNVCCFFFQSGEIKFELNIPYTGVAVGQDVVINLHIENMSNSGVEDVKFKIVKKIEFHSQTPCHKTKSREETIVKKRMTGVGAHGERTYEETLRIPENLPIFNINASNLIKISYTLQVKAVLPCPHNDINASIPIVIGHIPLTGVNLSRPQPLPSYGSLQGTQGPNYPPSHPDPSLAPTAPIAPTAPPAFNPPHLIGWTDPSLLNSNNANAPPPSYDEATKMH